jgi:hypothetical protein
MENATLGLWGIPLAVLAGAIRVSTPFLFVSLGECITERSGRVNLGLEGTLVMGAMSGYGVSYLTGSPWLGVLAAGAIGSVLGAVHGFLRICITSCSRGRASALPTSMPPNFTNSTDSCRKSESQAECPTSSRASTVRGT